MHLEQERAAPSPPGAAEETATLVAPSGGGTAGTGAGPPSVFLPSEVLAGRFRVLRLLGRGGMGEVYEVEDFELGERVAVKTLRSRLAPSDAALVRFRSEVQLARRVTHPNVCRTFDVFRHRRRAAGRSESVVFMTMELLAGESLAARVRRRGALPLAEALPLAGQIAAALDAAHAAGVVHRDLKSGNIVLVDGAHGRRAVVTDFGLAAAVEEAELGPAAGGTEPYRAPEQRAGKAAGPADLYAFGVVLGEMLTGSTEWSVVRGDLPPATAAEIGRCLDPRPERRPPCAGRVVRALERLAGSAAARRRRRAVAAACSVAVVAVTVAVAAVLAHRPPPVASAVAAEAPAHRRLAVVVVAPAGSPADCEECLGFLLAELLAVELAGSGLEVTTTESLFGAFGAIGFVQPGAPRWHEPETALDADLVAEVRTERLADGGRRLAVAVTPVDSRGSPLAAWEGRLAAGGETAAAAALAVRLRRALELPVGPPAASLRRALLGHDRRALELFVRGRRALSQSRVQQAAELFAEAVARQPRALRFQLALGEALTGLEGDSQRAVAAAEAARRLAAGLDGELGIDLRWRAEGLLGWADRDWTRAAEAMAALARRHPERVAGSVIAARMFLVAGRPEETRRLLDGLVERTPAAAADPRLLLLRADLSAVLGDGRGQLTAARAAISRARELDQPPMVFWGLYAELEALRRLGRNAEAGRAVEEALALATRLGHRRWLGTALRWHGVVLADAGEEELSAAAYRRGLRLAEETGDSSNAVWCLNNLAALATATGRLDEAAALYERSLDLLRRRMEQRGILLVRSNLSELWMLQGRLDDAEEASREVLAGARSLGAARIELLSVERLSEIALERGELGAAEHLLARAEELARDSEWIYLPEVLTGRTRLALLRGDTAAGRQHAEEAGAAAEASGDFDQRALALLARGDVERAEGRPRAALATYRQVTALAEQAPLSFLRARTERSLGLAQWQLGDAVAARRHLTAALAEHRRLGCELEAAHDGLALAELHLAQGDAERAAALATAALEIYRRVGHPPGAAAAGALLSRPGADRATGAGVRAAVGAAAR